MTWILTYSYHWILLKSLSIHNCNVLIFVFSETWYLLKQTWMFGHLYVTIRFSERKKKIIPFLIFKLFVSILCRLHSAGHLIDACLQKVGLGHIEPTKGYHFPDGYGFDLYFLYIFHVSNENRLRSKNKFPMTRTNHVKSFKGH